jgi:hypothetical protein
MNKVTNQEEAVLYAEMHQEDSNLARCYLANLAELNKLRSYYDNIVSSIGHDNIIKEYNDRGKLLKQESWLRKTVQESNRVLSEELALMRGRLEEESVAHENTMIERDNAEDMCDKITSAILDEPIDWQFHDQKWQDALLAVKSMHREIQFLRRGSSRSALERSIIGSLLNREYEGDLSDYETPLTERVKEFVESVDEQVAIIQKQLK